MNLKRWKTQSVQCSKATETQREQGEDQTESDTPYPELLGSTFDSELFQLDDVEGSQRRQLTRAQKRAGHLNHQQEQLKTVGNNKDVVADGLELSMRHERGEGASRS